MHHNQYAIIYKKNQTKLNIDKSCGHGVPHQNLSPLILLAKWRSLVMIVTLLA